MWYQVHHIQIGIENAILAEPKVLEVGRYALQKLDAHELVKLLEPWYLVRILRLYRCSPHVRAGIVISDTPEQHHGLQEQKEGVRIRRRMAREDLLRCEVLGVA